MKKYHVMRKSDPDFMILEWERKCDDTQIPFIHIVKGTKYSEVRWDLLGFIRRRAWSHETEDSLIQELIKIHQKYSEQKKYNISVCYTHIPKISHENSPKCAVELHDLFRQTV